MPLRPIILLTVLLLPLSIIAQSITDGLIVHYKLDGNASDDWFNGLDGVLSGPIAVDNAAMESNSAIKFDGVDDYVQLPSSSMLKPALPFSYSYMYRFETLNQTDNYMVGTDFEENNYHGSWTTLTADGTGSVSVNFGGGAGNNGSGNRRSKVSNDKIVTQKWYRLTFVVRGASDMDIYIDCVNAGGTYSGSGPSQVAYSTVPGSLGRMDAHTGVPPYYCNGSMDDFAFWDRALTQSEVESICNGILGVGDPIGYNPINVSPNPTNGPVRIDIGKENDFVAINVFNSVGALMKSKSISGSSFVVITMPETSGIYFVQIVRENGSVSYQKVVKE